MHRLTILLHFTASQMWIGIHAERKHLPERRTISVSSFYFMNNDYYTLNVFFRVFFFVALRTLECSFNWHQSFLNGMLALKNVMHIIKQMHKWIKCNANEYLQRRRCRLSFDFRYFSFILRMHGWLPWNWRERNVLIKKMWTYVSELSQYIRIYLKNPRQRHFNDLWPLKKQIHNFFHFFFFVEKF